MTDMAVETRGLHKAYGRTVALESLDLLAGRGEVVGLLGPTARAQDHRGSCCWASPARRARGPCSGAPAIAGRGRASATCLELFRYQAWLTADEVLRLHAGLAGIPWPLQQTEIPRVLELVGLADRAGDRIGGFSKGMQQRLGLAAALMGDPALVILDEPTSALDPVGRDDVRAIIREAKSRGSAVLLNSHLLGEVERLCDRVTIVNKGRVVAAGSLGELLGEAAVRLRVTGLPADRRALDAFGPVSEEDGWLVIRPVDPERIPDVVAACVALGGRVHAVDPGRLTLEELFLDLVRGSDSGPAEPPGPPPPPTAWGRA
ncbi:MAG: ABC transporter ATP-binding protein [Chloroflexota bacterium]